jgi:hypothetical protein
MTWFESVMTTAHAHGFFTYGQTIPGLVLHGQPAPYPVLNERAIRAGAGITLALGAFAFAEAWFLGNFVYLSYLVLFLWFDFFMKTVIGVRFSPVSRLAGLIVRAQAPEYVGAIQKRFAWTIGLILATAMVLLLWVFEVRGPLNLAICTLCLTFMYLETSFGICVGCKLYNGLIALGVIARPEIKPVCPGNVCAIE